MFGRVIVIKFFYINNCDVLLPGTEGILKVYYRFLKHVRLKLGIKWKDFMVLKRLYQKSYLDKT